MPLLPAAALTLRCGLATRKTARNLHGRLEHRRSALQCEVDSHLHVLDQSCVSERQALAVGPMQRHAGAHQLTRPAHPRAAERPNEVFHAPSKLGVAPLPIGPFRREHQIERLHGSMGLRAAPCELIYTPVADSAVSVDDDYKFGRLHRQVAQPMV